MTKCKILIYNAKDTLAKGGKRMVEKFKTFMKKSFSNGPKAKIVIFATACVVAVAATTVAVMRKTVKLSIDGKEETFITYKGTVKDVLQEKGVEVSEYDKVQPSLESKIEKAEEIEVKKAVSINVKFAKKDIKILSTEDNVEDALLASNDQLKKEGVEYVHGVDEVEPSLDTPIKESMDIDVTKVETKNVTEHKAIPFDTITKSDADLEKGKKKVEAEGKDGKQEVTYQVVYKNGKEASKKEVSSKTVAVPVNAVIVHGTKDPVNYIPNRGNSVAYKKHLVMESTAYSGHTTTATGVKPMYNPGGTSTIAVDPRVIPLGSLVYVEGYGYARASDTGGAIKGNIIDVFFNNESQCNQWGRKHGVDVYIVSYPGE